jgi:hypothetical protein
MRSPIRAAVPLALAASIVAVAPAAADKPAPTARASGGDVVAVAYPSLVQTRVGRTNRALRRAVKQIENNDPASAATLKVVRRQMAAAWRGAKYVIRTTPPPPAEEASVQAHKSADDDLVLAATPASPADTGTRVLMLQHHVAATMIQLVDGAHGAGLNALSTTLYLTLNRRDQALRDILALSPPAPPAEDRAYAHASGGAPILTTFDTLMPEYVPFLVDEQQAIDGITSDATDLTAGGRRLLNRAKTQVIATTGFVNTTWPPVVADD